MSNDENISRLIDDAANVDCPDWNTRKALPGVERAYRRGYTQGYWAAMKDIEERGAGSAKDWFVRRLMPWRTRLKWNREKPAAPVKWEVPPVPRQGQ